MGGGRLQEVVAYGGSTVSFIFSIFPQKPEDTTSTYS